MYEKQIMRWPCIAKECQRGEAYCDTGGYQRMQVRNFDLGRRIIAWKSTSAALLSKELGTNNAYYGVRYVCRLHWNDRSNQCIISTAYFWVHLMKPHQSRYVGSICLHSHPSSFIDYIHRPYGMWMWSTLPYPIQMYVLLPQRRSLCRIVTGWAIGSVSGCAVDMTEVRE